MRLKNPRLHNQIQELKTRIKLFENCSPDKKNELWKDILRMGDIKLDNYQEIRRLIENYYKKKLTYKNQ